MTETWTMDSLKEIFRFPFQQEGWQQPFLIGSVLILAGFFIPIVPLVFVAGYVARVMAQAIAREAPSLPRWEDWGELGRKGLRLTAISLIYLLPGAVITIGGFIFYMGVTMLSPLLIPLLGDETATSVLIMLIVFGGLGILFLSLGVGSLLLLAGGIPLPLAAAHATSEDSFTAAFRIGEWRRYLRRDRLGYFIVWVLVAGLGTILYGALALATYSIVLCTVTPFIMAPLSLYVSLVSAVLFGQMYSRMRDRDTGPSESSHP